jgi:hypothetical protein
MKKSVMFLTATFGFILGIVVFSHTLRAEEMGSAGEDVLTNEEMTNQEMTNQEITNQEMNAEVNAEEAPAAGGY